MADSNASPSLTTRSTAVSHTSAGALPGAELPGVMPPLTAHASRAKELPSPLKPRERGDA
eukprot:3586552-Alexandrium_andersonii.AAC.1